MHIASSHSPARSVGRTRRHTTNYNFYRAVYFSAKRGIAIACRSFVRLSGVRPSVRDVDGADDRTMRSI